MFQVARTYWRRPRFWVLSGLYLYLVVSMTIGLANQSQWLDGTYLAENRTLFAAMLGTITNLVCCFLGLHLRRQFASPLAKLVPGFARAHLAVAGVVIGLFWIVIPLAIAAILGARPSLFVAILAQSVMLLALVVLWRGAVILVILLPVAASMLALLQEYYHWELAQRFVLGKAPFVEALMIASALALIGVAVRRLITMSDLGTANNDDLAADQTASMQESGRFRRQLLRWRDSAAERWLASAGGTAWSVRRWRLPVISAREDLAIAAGLLIGGMIVSWFVFDIAFVYVVLLLGVISMTAYPFLRWHEHRAALATQFMRPVSRAEFFHQLASAFAWDVTLWIGMALVILFGADLVLARLEQWKSPFGELYTIQAATLICMTLFSFGMMLATFRWKLSVLITGVAAILWPFAVLFAAVVFNLSWTRDPMTMYVGFWLLTTGVGLSLTALAYVRSRSVELG